MADRARGCFVDIASSCDIPSPMPARDVRIRGIGRESLRPPQGDAGHETLSPVRRDQKIALLVKDAVNMTNFYCKGLGLRRALTHCAQGDA